MSPEMIYETANVVLFKLPKINPKKDEFICPY